MAFGCLPNDQTDDQLRIQTHVAYAEFLLRTADVSGMSEAQKTDENRRWIYFMNIGREAHFREMTITTMSENLASLIAKGLFVLLDIWSRKLRD